MVVNEKIIFKVFERNEEICIKTNIELKYNKIGWSELRWNFSTKCREGTDSN